MRKSRVIALTVAVVVALGAGGTAIVLAQDNDKPSKAEGVPVVAAPATCKGYVALTFDDGPTPLTGDYLAVLSKHGVKAMFFNRGDAESKFPGAVEAIDKGGHQFGNHTFSHPDLLTLQPAQVAAQIKQANDVHTPVAGPFDFFRPPYGQTSPAIRAAALAQGQVEVLWTVDSKDYEATTPQQVVDKSMGMRDGGILLLHDGHPNTVGALPQIINAYHSQGLCFGKVAVSEAEQESSWGPLFNARAVKP